MKVYVNEFPKRCLECGLCCKDDLGYWCQGREDVEAVFIADEMCNETRLQSCPLQSLSDYTKQVRKEVCEEIKDDMIMYGTKTIYNSNGDAVGTHECLSLNEIKNILDQIQGE